MVLPDGCADGGELRFQVSFPAACTVCQTKTGNDVGGVIEPLQSCGGYVH